MYHTMLPPHVMVQLVAGQRSNGQCPPIQNQSNPIPEANNNSNRNTQQYSHTTSYSPNGNGHNRHRLMQRTNYPLGLYQMMGVDAPQMRRGYGKQNGGNSHGNWQRRSNNVINNNNNKKNNDNNGSDSLMLPPPHQNYRSNNNNGSLKKPYWNNNKYGKRNNNSNKDHTPSVQNEMNNYNSDSGISSRSPTPNLQTPDSILAESSDDRDSVSSSADHEIKEFPKLPRNVVQGVRISPLQGFIPQMMQQQQYYYNERFLDFHQNESPNARATQVDQNHQGKKRYAGRATTSIQKNQRGRKCAGIVIPTFNIYSKTLIIPSEFDAKSIFVQCSKPPDNLICHSQWDSLSKDIWKKFVANQQSENTYRKKIMLWKYLYIYLKSIFPKYGLFLVGSTMNGFGSDTSDVDICLIVRNTEFIQRTEALWHLNQVMMALPSYQLSDFITNLELIPAKVPILKFRDEVQHLDVDLNCNNCVGVRNTHLLYCYSQIDWRVRPLVLVVKLWAQTHDINDAKFMTISSYSLVLMVIHFLQCGINPPILPCLHSLFTQKFDPHTDVHLIDIHEELSLPKKSAEEINHQPLGELLYEFLKYYAHFNFKSYAISVRTARKLPIDECRHGRSWRNDPHHWNYLGIEEPFDLTNTARSVHNYDEFLRILSVFRWSYETLRDKRCLSSIFIKHFPRPNVRSPKP